jgi:hypothetical protein
LRGEGPMKNTMPGHRTLIVRPLKTIHPPPSPSRVVSRPGGGTVRPPSCPPERRCTAPARGTSSNRLQHLHGSRLCNGLHRLDLVVVSGNLQ